MKGNGERIRMAAPERNMKERGTGKREKSGGIAELARRAKRGDGEAAWVLGEAYADGDEICLEDGTREKVRRDVGKAVRWLRLAVALGEADALCRLGCLLAERGREKGVAEGIALMKRAWRKGCRVAAQNLAVTYSELGKPRRCVEWLRKGCRHEESTDWFLLGIAHAAGYGVRKDLDEAARLFRKVRDDGAGFPVEREEAAGFLDMLVRGRAIRVTGAIGRTHPEGAAG